MRPAGAGPDPAPAGPRHVGEQALLGRVGIRAAYLLAGLLLLAASAVGSRIRQRRTRHQDQAAPSTAASRTAARPSSHAGTDDPAVSWTGGSRSQGCRHPVDLLTEVLWVARKEQRRRIAAGVPHRESSGCPGAASHRVTGGIDRGQLPAMATAAAATAARDSPRPGTLSLGSPPRKQEKPGANPQKRTRHGRSVFTTERSVRRSANPRQVFRVVRHPDLDGARVAGRQRPRPAAAR